MSEVSNRDTATGTGATPSGGPPVASEVCARARCILRSEKDLRLAIVYGSMATEKCRPDSDVDLGVLFGQPMTAQQKMDLAGRLEQAMLRGVDLVDLSTACATLLRQILRKGRVLVQRDPGAMAGLVRTMVYHEADMMPYVRRTLIERQHRFAHGS
jgi:uncharacterized protein